MYLSPLHFTLENNQSTSKPAVRIFVTERCRSLNFPRMSHDPDVTLCGGCKSPVVYCCPFWCVIWCWFYHYRSNRTRHNALMAVVCVSVSVPDPKSRVEGRSKLKIVRKEMHDTGDPWPHLEVERSKALCHIIGTGSPKNLQVGKWWSTTTRISDTLGDLWGHRACRLRL